MLLISNKEARHLMLVSQGLHSNFFGTGKAATLKVIEHLGYVQIDTIAVVERAHHHTIWTSVNDYKSSYLNELLEKDRLIFEYWSHAAAYLPMRDYRFSLVRKNLFAGERKKWYDNKKMIRFVYDRIKTEGPLQSKDFEEKKKLAGWWDWKESKRALEQLFMEGKLLISRRQGFQKVYDITERVLPAEVDTKTPTDKEYAEYLVIKTIRANGLAAKGEIGYLRPHTKAAISKLIAEMEEEGRIISLQVEGSGDVLYTMNETLQAAKNSRIKDEVKIVSPFDNLVIQRNRLKRIFGFDYTIECYVPQAKRQYGYFCLPLLYGHDFIGRLDCKADRAKKELVLKNIFYEKGLQPSQKLKDSLHRGIHNFAVFNACKLPGVLAGLPSKTRM